MFRVKSRKAHLEVDLLKNEEDWLAARAVFKELEKYSDPNPWNLWQHFYNVYKIAFPDSTFWFVRIFKDGQPLAASIFREESSRRSGVCFKVLRSLDWNAGCVPVLVARHDMQDEACELLVKNLSRLHSKTGAHILCVNLLDQDYCRRLEPDLKKYRKIYKKSLLSQNQIILLDDWKEKSNLKKKLRNMRRNEKLLKQEFGYEGEFVRLRGDVIGELRQSGLWDQFEQLWAASWQSSFQTESGGDAFKQALGYTNDSIDYWSSKGWLDFCAYKLGDKLVSAYLNLALGGKVWMLQTYYAQEYQRFGVGSINLLKLILDSHERGDIWMAFGGEAIEWKRRWSNQEDPIYALEIGLGGLKGTAWKVMQRVKSNGEGQQTGRIHQVQSKNDFEKLKAAQEHSPEIPLKERIRIRPVRNELDWLDIKSDMQAMEKVSARTPWHSWDHYSVLWKSFFRSRRLWFVEIAAPSGFDHGTKLAALFMEEQGKKHGPLNVKTLRSLDQMSMAALPFWVDRNNSERAIDDFVKSLPLIGKATGCYRLSLYRQETESGQALIEALKKASVIHRSRVFTMDQIIDLPEELSDYLGNISKKAIKSITRKSPRKVERDFEEPASYMVSLGKSLKDPEVSILWKEFEALREKSWQCEEAVENGIPAGRLAGYFRDAADVWGEAGLLNLCFVKVADKFVAGLVCLKGDNEHFGSLTTYDRQYKKYGFGMLNFYNMLLEVHANGVRRIVMGGEGSDWKKNWSNSEKPLYQIECSLGGAIGKAWEFYKFLKKDGEGPVR